MNISDRDDWIRRRYAKLRLNHTCRYACALIQKGLKDRGERVLSIETIRQKAVRKVDM